jgi:hypothetical protein
MNDKQAVSELDRLVAIEEIRQLKARYFRAVDTKDWDLLESVFTEDVLLDFTQGGGSPKRAAVVGPSTVRGQAAAVARIQAAVAGAVTVHQGCMPEIEVASPTAATAIWAMADRLWYAEPSGSPYREIHAMGHYHERYVKVADEWLISALRLTRLQSLEIPW